MQHNTEIREARTQAAHLQKLAQEKDDAVNYLKLRTKTIRDKNTIKTDVRNEIGNFKKVYNDRHSIGELLKNYTQNKDDLEKVKSQLNRLRDSEFENPRYFVALRDIESRKPE
jgi:predicted RNase H-like nuclease (RuvC/YqgF family)